MLARLILCLIGSLGLAATVAAQPVVDPNIPRPGYLLVMGTPTDPAAMGRYARTLPPSTPSSVATTSRSEASVEASPCSRVHSSRSRWCSRSFPSRGPK